MLCFYWDQSTSSWLFDDVPMAAISIALAEQPALLLVPNGSHPSYHPSPTAALRFFFSGSPPPPQVINVLITTNRALLFQGFARVRAPTSHTNQSVCCEAWREGIARRPFAHPPPLTFVYTLLIREWRSDASFILPAESIQSWNWFCMAHGLLKSVLYEPKFEVSVCMDCCPIVN